MKLKQMTVLVGRKHAFYAVKAMPVKIAICTM
jgi:hypothetical protein